MVAAGEASFRLLAGTGSVRQLAGAAASWAETEGSREGGSSGGAAGLWGAGRPSESLREVWLAGGSEGAGAERGGGGAGRGVVRVAAGLPRWKRYLDEVLPEGFR